MSSNVLRETLAAIRPAVDSVLQAKIQARLDSLTKPPGSLGRLEQLVLRYGLIRGQAAFAMPSKGMVIFCADHGVTAEGISAYPPAVTRQMALNFVAGGAAICVLSRHHGIETRIVDVGIDGDTPGGVADRKVARGTRNFAQDPAMTREEAEQAIEAGIAMSNEPFDVFGAGEMGIGNTTSAAALLSAFARLDPAETAGRGTGLDRIAVAHKAEVIRWALQLHAPDPADPIGVLSAVGGLEIAAITGLILGAAARRRAVMLDGFISCSAALAARALAPASLDYVLFSHRSQEQGHRKMLEFLGADPLLDLELRLGEGSGAALGIGLLDAAIRVYREMATFSEAGVSEAS